MSVHNSSTVWHWHLNQSGSQLFFDHEWSDFLPYTSSDCNSVLSCVCCFLIRWKGKFRIQFNCSKRSILSFRLITGTWSTAFAERNLIFSRFQRRQASKLFYIWSPALKAPSPHLSLGFKSLPATRLGNRKDACGTTAAAAVTAAASDRGGRLAAVWLSLL